MIDVAAALEHVNIGRRSDFYFTLQTLLVHRQQDLALFDEAFRAFWRPPVAGWSAEDLRALGEQRRFRPPEHDGPASHAAGDGTSSRLEPRTIEQIAPLSYSAREVSRTKDFAHFTEDEIAAARTMLDELTWDLGRRRTRRWQNGPGRIPNPRDILRRNLRYGGEPRIMPMRARAWKPRPLVLVCDVSGSMERYSRILVHFVHTLSGRPDRVEVFLFATRLTRVTRELAKHRVDDVVPTMLRRMPDWGGGTRIGEALRHLNVHWARRVLGHGAVVLLISDGWDRGDPALLAGEMARLQRSCHRLVWLNPLLGSADYRPLTRGMRAALPFVDDFLPVHNLTSLEALAHHLNRLPPRRATRSPRSDITIRAAAGER
jgi:uncharacterized protein with von Willebrand factor type A (vWA) domain